MLPTSLGAAISMVPFPLALFRLKLWSVADNLQLFLLPVRGRLVAAFTMNNSAKNEHEQSRCCRERNDFVRDARYVL